MKDSHYNHDKTVQSLYPEGLSGDPRRAVMNSDDAIYRTFCRWCASVRGAVRNAYLECPKCDKAGPHEPIAARGR